MSYNLENELMKRSRKYIYKDKDSIIKLFVENYSVADILNEALILARVEEGCDLNIPLLKEVTKDMELIDKDTIIELKSIKK